MASFRVEPIVRTDFTLMLTPSHRKGGDLTQAPVAPLCWPVAEGDDEGALARLEYNAKQCRQWFDEDLTAIWLKAVKDDGEIVAMARWNFFPRGYDFETHETVDVGRFVPESAKGAFNLDLYRDMRTHMMRLRRDWLVKGPCWVLMAMVTRGSYRKQGAGSMLVNWGVEKARQDGVPAYLEASSTGKPVYERCGFQQVAETVPWDCRPYGVDVTFNLARMAYYPPELDSKS